MDKLYSPQEVEFKAKIQHSDNIGEIKEMIAKRKGVPLRYRKLHSDVHGVKTLEDDLRTIEECGLGLYPQIWMKHVLLIHVTLIENELRFSHYENVEKHSKLDDILLKIRKSHNVKKNESINVDYRYCPLVTPTRNSLFNTAEIQVTVFPPEKRSCNVMVILDFH